MLFIENLGFELGTSAVCESPYTTVSPKIVDLIFQFAEIFGAEFNSDVLTINVMKCGFPFSLVGAKKKLLTYV